MIIVLDCPGCRKRYEIDGALAGKKSRCRQCGEIFRIPVPSARPIEAAASAPTGPPSSAAPPRPARPQPAPATPPQAPARAPKPPAPRAISPLEDLLDGEPAADPIPRMPAARQVSSPPPPAAMSGMAPRTSAFDDDLPPPPRAQYQPARRKRRRSSAGRGGDTDLGKSALNLFVLLSLIAVVVMCAYFRFGEVDRELRSRIYVWVSGIIGIASFGLWLWGTIWMAALAFGEGVTQGLLCLFLPLYQLIFAVRSWEERRGAFGLTLAPVASILVFLVVGGLFVAANTATSQVDRYSRQITVPAALGGDPGGSSAAIAAPRNARRSSRKANAAAVRRAEQATRENVAALKEHARALSQIRDGATRKDLREVINSARWVEIIERRAQFIKLSDDEMVALKHSVGSEMRSALSAVRQEYARLAGMLAGRAPGLQDVTTTLDRAVDRWSIKPGEETPPTLVEEADPFDSSGTVASAGIGPSGDGAFMERARVQYHNLRVEFQDRVAAVLVSGMPGSGDPDRGPSGRDVVAAIRGRLRELAPEASRAEYFGSNDRMWFFLAPVNDPQALAVGIDFGTVTVKETRIEVRLDARWAANVPRLPPEPRPVASSGRPGSPPRPADPEVPPGADAITRSMIELKSSDQGRRKRALERLQRSTPDGRVDQVVGALLPLLEDDDGFFVTDVVKTLAVWRSPEALAGLIARTRDNRHFVRSEAIKALGAYPERTAAEAIVAVIEEDGFAVERALRTMGAAAEAAVIPLLRHAESGVRGHACRILADIGGMATLVEMQSLPPDPDLGVRMHAQNAWKKIVARVGPPPKPARGKTANGSKLGATGR